MGEEEKTRQAVKAAQMAHAKIVTGDDKERQKRALKEVEDVLRKHDCVLVPRAMLHPGGMEFIIETLVKPHELKEGPVDPPEEFKVK